MRAQMEWALTLVFTRVFGWNLPYSMIIPVIDMVNHSDCSQTEVDLFHTRLHMADNKIYLHNYNYDTINEWTAGAVSQFEERSQRSHYNVNPIY
mmetsp:Transcript_4384/g.7419  ORF Transcript_4384/g.7419 Transcript_4384/m.7419 type:complete len:94 (-) Transcript_4384:1489-1770(-)